MGLLTGFESVNVRDIGMIQRRQNLRFALKPLQPVSVIGERIRKRFNSDITSEFRIVRSVYDAHPALTQR
jgi:hypothetical protein